MKDLLTPDLEQEIQAIRRKLHRVEDEWKLRQAKSASGGWVFEPFSAESLPGPHRREASGGSASDPASAGRQHLFLWYTFGMGFVLGMIFAAVVLSL